MKILKDHQKKIKIMKLKYQVLDYQCNNKIIKSKKQIMKDENIYNLWTAFINDDKYSFVFSINKI